MWTWLLVGIASASFVWVVVCWVLLNQRDAARWEASHLRVCRCKSRTCDLAHWRAYPRNLHSEDLRG